MPIHDWTRVPPGLFHHFHQAWTIYLSSALNSGLLPQGYFALAEQTTGGVVPDILAIQLPAGRESAPTGGLAVAIAPPRTRFVQQAEIDIYAGKANRIAIRHPLGHVVAFIEIVSPGDKSSRSALRSFVDKSADFLRSGIHLLVIDLFPPGPRDPGGIHKAIWDEFEETPFTLPTDQPLTLTSYEAGMVKTAYVEPVAVGDELPAMPVFLEPGLYIPTPLETTYQTTWAACPEPFRAAVDAVGPPL